MASDVKGVLDTLGAARYSPWHRHLERHMHEDSGVPARHELGEPGSAVGMVQGEKLLQPAHQAPQAGDADGLRELRADDEKVDGKYTAVFRELLTYMMEDPRNITACTHLLFCAKNLERIGDHVTNIAENAYFVVTGSQLPANRPKVDEMATLGPASV